MATAEKSKCDLFESGAIHDLQADALVPSVAMYFTSFVIVSEGPCPPRPSKDRTGDRSLFVPLSHEEFDEFAKRHGPPQSWYDEEFPE